MPKNEIRRSAVRARHASVIADICRGIQALIANEALKLKDLARKAGMSAYHLHRMFRSAVGVTPRQYVAANRMESFRSRLSPGEPITGAIYDAGFTSSSRLYEKSASTLGMRPTRYRDGAPGEDIRFSTASCSLGAVLVAATRRGVCAVELGAYRGPLLAGLRKRFPKARLRASAPALRDWVRRVVSFVEKPERPLALPLDIQGTAFQRRVWTALQAVPAGRTATYAEIAERIGRRGAARAVARACGSNKIALAIPCHRVIGSDGAPRGYRWGVERKRRLLERERRVVDAQRRASAVVAGQRGRA